MSNNQNKEENKKKKLIVRIILTLLLLLLLAFTLNRCGYIRFPWEPERMLIGNVRQGNLPGISDEDLLAALQEQADNSNVTVQLNSQPVFEDGTSEGSLFLGNPDFNQFDMHVVITHDETLETLYDSGLIPPGYYIDYDKLEIALGKGTHSATARVTYFEGNTVRTTTEFKINIIVKN